jgi:outer membrane lipoprotein SlyB
MTISIAKKATSLIAAGAFALLFAAATASAQQPVRVRGTIEKVDGQVLTVKARDGATLTVKLADNAPVRTVVRRSLADVKVNAFIGITAMPQPDGTQKAVEIHIFPEAMRGTGEGHRPWDLMPNSTMTNANVDSAVVKADGQELVLKYKDGEKTFIVPANVEVVEFAPGTTADLKPGEHIFVVAAKKLPDGTLEAPAVTVGGKGVNPPM